jgi:hypothetical protein
VEHIEYFDELLPMDPKLTSEEVIDHILGKKEEG